VFGRNRARAFWFITNGAGLLAESWLALLSLALKWFNPGFLPNIFPFFVTRSLFVNDLLVFIPFGN